MADQHLRDDLSSDVDDMIASSADKDVPPEFASEASGEVATSGDAHLWLESSIGAWQSDPSDDHLLDDYHIHGTPRTPAHIKADGRARRHLLDDAAKLKRLLTDYHERSRTLRRNASFSDAIDPSHPPGESVVESVHKQVLEFARLYDSVGAWSAVFVANSHIDSAVPVPEGTEPDPQRAAPPPFGRHVSTLPPMSPQICINRAHSNYAENMDLEAVAVWDELLKRAQKESRSPFWPGLVVALQMWMAVPEVNAKHEFVTAAVAALRCITRSDGAKLQFDAYHKLYELMRFHHGESRLAREALMVLFNVCAFEANKQTVVSTAGLSPIVDAMNQHRAVEDVQSEGCALISRLAAGSQAHYRTYSLMQVCLWREVLAQYCFFSLFLDDEFKNLVLVFIFDAFTMFFLLSQACVLSHLLQSMSLHPHSARVQIDACSALRNLAMSEMAERRAVSMHALDLVFLALHNHPDDIGVQKEASCVSVFSFASKQCNSRFYIILCMSRYFASLSGSLCAPQSRVRSLLARGHRARSPVWTSRHHSALPSPPTFACDFEQALPSAAKSGSSSDCDGVECSIIAFGRDLGRFSLILHGPNRGEPLGRVA
jgi:hypothetical protein